jgi:uncharacterized protein (DUF2235 family)
VKRLALFVDGTWNVASNNTNVWRLHLLTAPADEAGTPQETYYHVGVGTDRTNHLRGAFGKGINASVRDSYAFAGRLHRSLRSAQARDACVGR